MTITRHDEHRRLENRLDHGIDRLADELGRIVDDRVLDAGWEALRERIHGPHDRRRRWQRIRAGALEDRDRDRGLRPNSNLDE